MKTGKKDSDPAELLSKFLDVCNRSMDANREKFPYCHIWRAAEDQHRGDCVEFVLVDDRPKALCHISLSGGQIQQIEAPQGEDTSPALKVTLSYIEDVVKEPEKYIDNPGLINWDWLKLSSSSDS